MLPACPATSPLMAKRPPATPRMPAYLKWRAGRPRWEPGPALRARGYQGRDLKDAAGQWLTLGAAVDAAGAINTGIAGGDPTVTTRPPARSLGALLDAVESQPKWKDDGAAPDGTRRGRRLAHTTLLGYQSFHRLLREWGGATPVAAFGPSDIATLYDRLVEHRGITAANRCLGTLKTDFNFAINNLKWLTHNPVKGLEMVQEEGRLVRWTVEENVAFIRCADWMGFESIADAHIVGLMTAQSRKDVLAMPELDLDVDVFRLQRRKTGRPAFIPATSVLSARIAMMRRRKAQRWPGVVYRHEIISSWSGAPYALDGSTFTHEHRQVRAVASGLQSAIEQAFPQGAPALDYDTAPFTMTPSIWGKRFHDLRDTAITILLELTKGDRVKVANISGHSLSTVDAVVDKHYFVRNAELSRGVGEMIDGLMEKIGFAG